MDDDLRALFERQAEWQKSLARLSWSEKLRIAAKLRDAALALRAPRDVAHPTLPPKR